MELVKDTNVDKVSEPQPTTKDIVVPVHEVDVANFLECQANLNRAQAVVEVMTEQFQSCVGMLQKKYGTDKIKMKIDAIVTIPIPEVTPLSQAVALEEAKSAKAETKKV